MTHVLALANQKGGVGKTTTAVNLATALAAVGQRTLLIDLDPQANASMGMGYGAPTNHSVYEVLRQECLPEEAIFPSSIPNFLLMPASQDLSGIEITLATQPDRTSRLKQAISEVRDQFDYIVIDCPPALSLLTINALAAVEQIIIPLQCEYYALEGLGQLVKSISSIQATINPNLEILGVLLTMFDRRNRLSEFVAADVRKTFGNRVFNSVIPRNVRVSEAPSHGKPVLLYDVMCEGSKSYIKLAAEILKRNGGYHERNAA